MKKGGNEYNSKKNLFAKSFYLLLALLIFTVFGFNANVSASLPTNCAAAINPGYSGCQIYLNYGTSSSPCYVDLQTAINKGNLTKPFSVTSSSSPVCEVINASAAYLFANQILMTFGANAYIMTIQDAISNNVFINGATTDYTNNLIGSYDNARNINISLTGGFYSTFQQAINNNALTGSCVSNVGQACSITGDASCISSSTGTIQCNGQCSASYFARGTSCSSDGWHACDGKGNCQGWSGNGCGSCPWGSSSGGTGYTCNNPPDATSSYTYTCAQDVNYVWNTAPPNAPTCSNQCNCGLSGCSQCGTQWYYKP